MDKNKITMQKIEEIIENHCEQNRNMCFICDYELTNYIVDFVIDKYFEVISGNAIDYIFLSEEVDEYYITILPYEKEIQFFCENMKTNDGRVKFCDIGDGDYFIGLDLEKDVVDEKLIGDGTWSYFEIIDEEDNCCPRCELVKEILDSILSCDSYEESFETLGNWIDAIRSNELRNVSEAISQLAEEI